MNIKSHDLDFETCCVIFEKLVSLLVSNRSYLTSKDGSKIKTSLRQEDIYMYHVCMYVCMWTQLRAYWYYSHRNFKFWGLSLSYFSLAFFPFVFVFLRRRKKAKHSFIRVTDCYLIIYFQIFLRVYYWTKKKTQTLRIVLERRNAETQTHSILLHTHTCVYCRECFCRETKRKEKEIRV